MPAVVFLLTTDWKKKRLALSLTFHFARFPSFFFFGLLPFIVKAFAWHLLLFFFFFAKKLFKTLFFFSFSLSLFPFFLFLSLFFS